MISLSIRLLRYASFVHYNDFDLFFIVGFDIIFCLFYSDLQGGRPSAKEYNALQHAAERSTMEEIDSIKESDSKRKPFKAAVKRSLFDRRSGEDKRKLYNLDYFSDGGKERRKGKERRQSDERRTGWARVYNWCSVFLGRKAQRF